MEMSKMEKIFWEEWAKKIGFKLAKSLQSCFHSRHGVESVFWNVDTQSNFTFLVEREDWIQTQAKIKFY